MLTLWTTEQTGGDCSANVAHVTDDRTGLVSVVVVTSDHQAFSTAARDADGDHESVCVSVYDLDAWHAVEGVDPLPSTTVEAPLGRWVDDDWHASAVDWVALFSDALADAGLHLESTDPVTGVSVETTMLASTLMTLAGQ